MARTFRGVIPLITSRLNTYLIVLCAVAAATLAVVASLPGLFLPKSAAPYEATFLQFVIQPAVCVTVAVIWGVTFEGAIRTARPGFRLGPVELVTIVLLAVGRYLAVVLGLLVLVLPGVFITVRFSPLLVVYALDERRGSNAISETWFLTAGHFWLLFGVEILATLAVATAAGLLGGACGAAVAIFPPSVIVLAPLATAVAIYLLTAYHLLYVEVVETLRDAATSRGLGITAF